MLVGEDGGGSVGTVHVEPELDGGGAISPRAMRSSTAPELVVPAVPTMQKGLWPAAEICAGSRLRGLRGSSCSARVYGDAAEGAAAESEEANGFVERVMAFRGGVENRLGSRWKRLLLQRSSESEWRGPSRAREKLASLPPLVKVPSKVVVQPTRSPIQRTVSASIFEAS